MAKPTEQATLPFGVPEIVAAAGTPATVLDAGCGSARLTVALALAGAGTVTGIDTSAERIAQGRERIAALGLGERVELVESDFNEPLPFEDSRFGAVTSRLSLMIPADPVATLRELRRVTAAGGPVVTVLWAPPDQNPWFALPRTAARADYARVFGRIGTPADARAVHEQAGLGEVEVRTLTELLELDDAAALWAWMVTENGHVRRVDGELSPERRTAVIAALEDLCVPYRGDDGRLHLPRTMTLVSAQA